MGPRTLSHVQPPAEENSVRRLPLQAGVLHAEEVVWEAEASPRVCGHSLLPQAATGCKERRQELLGNGLETLQENCVFEPPSHSTDSPAILGDDNFSKPEPHAYWYESETFVSDEAFDSRNVEFKSSFSGAVHHWKKTPPGNLVLS
ncbi:unnamed protein product [Larinioides sclopetarius]|uniref:Uncharacterized protein n=1 Tax=Larinioides sclopetarius TaxID=280406 RepID=A0AAV1ZV28_9ARAC